MLITSGSCRVKDIRIENCVLKGTVRINKNRR